MLPRHSVSRASSNIARLRRHGRVPTDAEVVDAYQELWAARIERAIRGEVRPGLQLDPTRSAFLVELLAAHTAVLV